MDVQERRQEAREVAQRVLWVARAQGHDMHAWRPTSKGVGLYAFCRRCGQGLTIRVDDRGEATARGCEEPCQQQKPK